MEELRNWCIDRIKENPELQEEINDFYQLCVDEVENGESLTNEIDLCMNSVNELIDYYGRI